MMGVLLTVKNADFSANAVAFVPPVVDGLEYWNYFGGTAANSVRNMVTGKTASSLVGSPTVGAGFISASQTDCVRTAILDQAEVTLLAVGRGPANVNTSGWGMMISNYGSGGASQGSSVAFVGSGSFKGGVGTAVARVNGVDINAAPDLPSADHSAWTYAEARIGNAFLRVRDRTRNTGSTVTPGSARVTSGTAYRVGAPYGGVTTFGMDIAFAAIYSRVLTDAEVDSVYQRVKAYLSTKSIVV